MQKELESKMQDKFDEAWQKHIKESKPKNVTTLDPKMIKK